MLLEIDTNFKFSLLDADLCHRENVTTNTLFLIFRILSRTVLVPLNFP